MKEIKAPKTETIVKKGSLLKKSTKKKIKKFSVKRITGKIPLKRFRKALGKRATIKLRRVE